MKRLIYIFLFLPLLLNGQQLIEKKTCPFKGYAFQCDGASNYISATNNNFVTDTGIISFSFTINNSNKLDPVSFSDGSFHNLDYIYINGTSSSNESFSILIISEGTVVFRMYLLKGKSFFVIGRKYDIKIIIDGVNNRFVVNDTTYDMASGDLYINTGSQTTKYLITGNQMNIGRRITTSSIYFDGDISNVCITNLHDTLAYYPLSEGGGSVAYDVTGGGNETIHGSNYWTTLTNSYNENYGVTKVKYNGQSIFVPYTINKTPIYNHSTPIMNSNEKYINYPDTLWGKKYWVK